MTSILTELSFDSILNESYAVTQTGSEIMDRYKSYLMVNPVNFGLVNNFIRESRNCRYDSGINKVLESVADFITCNKTKWALASACESIKSNNNSYNYLNKNAAKQVEKLLEMSEEDVVKYIKAGALKNVMFCESFRNIAKQVYKDHPIIESTAEYVVKHPVSLVENVGDGICFEVAGTLYKLDDDKNIQESRWDEVSSTFRTISQLLESNMTSIDNSVISINAGNSKYEISEEGKCVKITGDKRVNLTLEQLRDNNRLVVMAVTPTRKNQLAAILEGVAQICENYNNIVNMDNVSIYHTNRDKFVVIESEDKLYATLLSSNHSPKWTINENAIDALSFINSKTRVNLGDRYKTLVESNIAAVSEQEQERIEEELKEQQISSYRTRVELLTEKFKNDPIKLAILSKIAQQIPQ